MKILYMGTPDFAVGPLQAIIDAGYEVCGVITRQDKPKGRGMKVFPTPVKELALKYEIPVYQPLNLRNDEAEHWIADKNPDVIVVVAYGRILPKNILDIPLKGCINVHASLLPQLRGSAPIQWSIVNGLKETGVTTMFMSEELDEGDMLLKAVTPIYESDTAETLHDRLMELGKECIVETLKKLETGNLERIKQDSSLATYAPMIRKEDTKIDWNKSAEEIRNLIRGMTPWPTAWTQYEAVNVKFYSASVTNEKSLKTPGSILTADSKNGLKVACGNGTVLEINELQMPGGKKMKAKDYLLGHSLSIDTKFI